MAGYISQILQELYMACAHRLGDISHGLRLSARQRRLMTSIIIQGLRASNVVCVHLESDI